MAFRCLCILSWATALVLASAGTSEGMLSCPKIAPASHWRDVSRPQRIPPGGALYYSFRLPGGSRVHVVVADMKSGRWALRPVVASATEPLAQIATAEGAQAAVNGGYFNLSDGVSASYVLVNGTEAANPHQNKALVENPRLAPFLETIFNRSEIRVVQGGASKPAIEIANHNTPPTAKILYSLQAGPRLLPTLTDKNEAFVRQESSGKDVDSIGAGRPAARTAFGITNDGYAVLVAVAGTAQEQGSPGITLASLAELMRNLGCTEAINLDGGSSTTMYVRAEANNPASAAPPAAATPAALGLVVCGKNPETRVKSALVLVGTPH
jgi:hypothetical protein